VEYRPCKRQGHCAALSRCPAPKDCTCAKVDMLEPEKCGPCNKCRRRAEVMCADRSSPHSKEQQRQAEIRAVHEASPSEDDPPITRSRPWLCLTSVAEMAGIQRADNAIAPVLCALTEERFLEPSDMTTMSADTRYYFRTRKELLIVDWVLYR